MPTPPPPAGPALGLLELQSLARGVVVADAALKRAPVRILLAEAVTPGKYLLLFTGPVAEVEEAFAAAVEAAGPLLLDRLRLAHFAEAALAAVEGRFQAPAPEAAVGLLELATVAATLRSLDVALKTSAVAVTRLQLARGIGGKGWFALAGDQADVEAALQAGASALEPGLVVGRELVARPHPGLAGPVLP